MLTDPMRFADSWVQAWNRHDLNEVLAHYEDDFELESPYVVLLLGNASGKLRGKEAARTYWELALTRAPDLHFETVAVWAGVNVLTIQYVGPGGRMSLDLLEISDAGLIKREVALESYP